MLKKNPKAAREGEYEWPEIENLPWSDIETYARMLMSGYGLDDGNGRRSSHYLSDDPEGDWWIPKERYARKAMARLLRSGPLTLYDRECLAALFDPDDNTHPAIDRKVIFQQRSAGRSRDHTRDSAIRECIYNDLRDGHDVKDAIQKAMGLFGMEKKAVEKIWYEPGFRKFLEQIYGPLPKQKRGRPKKNHLLK